MHGVASPKANDAIDSLTISIRVEPDGSTYARNVELVNNDTRLRFVFGQGKPLQTVFSAGMARELAPLINRALDRRGILVLPDMRVYLKNLVLAQCRVLMTPSGTGGEQVLICFGEYIGNAYSIFHESITKLGEINREVGDVAVELLEDAYLPIMNLGEHLKTVMDRKDELSPDELKAEMVEVYDRILSLKFYQSMLVRFINAETMEERNRAMKCLSPPAGAGIDEDRQLA